MLYKKSLLLFFLGMAVMAQSQSSYIPKNHPAYHAIDRMDVMNILDSKIHTSVKPHFISDIQELLGSIEGDSLGHSIREDYNFLYREYIHNSDDSLYADRKGLWNTLYKNPAHLFELRTADFQLTIDPYFNLRIGRETNTSRNIISNKRGIELYGHLDDKLYFYSAVEENQSNFLNYINPFIDRYKAIPGYANYKDFQSSILSSFNGYDYGNARAYLGYMISRHVNLELGHNNHFIGQGMRSLLLSDFSQNYFYLKMNVRVWKLQYQSIFAELSSISSRQTPNNILLPKKYMASHFLNFKPNKNFEIGLFESIIFSREDHFEFQYLNPLILYRSAEHFLDSPDNVLIGLNAKLDLFNHFSLYGQFLLDDIQLGEFFSGSGFWGNKYGFQLGLKYYDVLDIKFLDAQVELNRVRPYTYSHFRSGGTIPNQSISSYSHFNQALAHPLGSNFTEVIFKLRYQPLPKVVVNARYIYSLKGRNYNGNFGSDILLTNLDRVQEYNVDYHQGALSKISMIDLDISYELFHDFYLDLNVLLRQDNNADLGDTKTTFMTTGIRYNIYNSKIDY